MNYEIQRLRAESFRQSHYNDRILILPNAWDTGSAVMFDRAGFQAVGTTSAGVAYSLGYPDGEDLPLNLLFEYVKRTSERISAPLSVDFEEGFGRTPDEVAKQVETLISCGAVGLNIEDTYFSQTQSLVDIDYFCEIIRAISQVRQSSRIPFVINARVNTHWYPVHSTSNLLSNAIERSNRCLAAGADCAFVPGISSLDDIKTLVKETKGPVNILASKDCPTVQELQDLGVARVSIGSTAARAMLGRLQGVINELQGAGTYSTLYEQTIPYAEANKIFQRDRVSGN